MGHTQSSTAPTRGAFTTSKRQTSSSSEATTKIPTVPVSSVERSGSASDTKRQKTAASLAAWPLTLLNQVRIGVPIITPAWYMRRETNAVLPGGTQAAATCGLHAFNHVMHAFAGFRPWTWAEFDARVPAQECDAAGNWEFAAMQANIHAAGASIEPVEIGELSESVAWVDDWHRLRVWQPSTLGLLVHVPGHWIAVVRPEGAGTMSNVALLCDSLRPAPFQLNHAEIHLMMTSIQQYLRNASLAEAGEWSVYRVFR